MNENTIGFTGTRDGMTRAQKDVFASLLARMKPTEFHHGDCKGSDEEAHYMVCRLSPLTRIVIHPPSIDTLRAYCRVTDNPSTRCPALPYLVRNQNIVLNSKTLIATPKESSEQLRGGTWSTIRYAKKMAKRVIVIWKDGLVEDSHDPAFTQA